MEFDYNEAFSRNIGWVTEKEQSVLSKITVAIAGMGGVGGNYLLTLARLGVQKFHLSDFDTFELANFNRQVGATTSSIGRSKLDTMIELALDINPNIQITKFEDGIHKENSKTFLQNVDIYLDGLDVYCIDIRQEIFSLTEKLGTPAITVGPIGMGAALVSFIPGHMSFEQYFNFKQSDSEVEKIIKFVVGLSPSSLHKNSLVDSSRFDPKNKKAPSIIMGCQLCSGVIATELLKIVLNRGKVWPAPYSIHFDAYSNRIKRNKTVWGNKGPLQKLKIKIAKKQLGAV